jgi:hypothetical protein
VITAISVICQDQLQKSGRDGYVLVTCLEAGGPASGLTRDDGRPSPPGDTYSVQPGGLIQTRRPGTDGAFEQALVLPNGNLLYRPLEDGPGYVLLGAGLKAL